MTLLTELEDLAAEATPPPWGICPRFGGNGDAMSIVGDDSIIATAWDRDAHGKEHCAPANARLIATLVSNLPEIMEALRLKASCDWFRENSTEKDHG